MDETPLAPLSHFRSVVTGAVGRQHEKPLRQALYNIVAITFLVVCTVVTYGVYCVLEGFVRPLVWAALCGSFLFPFKKVCNSSNH